jgi:hypothetical protein
MTNVRVINAFGAELELQSLLTSALDGSSELHSPVVLLLVKQTPTTIHYEVWGTAGEQTRSGHWRPNLRVHGVVTIITELS